MGQREVATRHVCGVCLEFLRSTKIHNLEHYSKTKEEIPKHKVESTHTSGRKIQTSGVNPATSGHVFHTSG